MKRGQYSLETVFVIGISSVLLLPAVYLFYDFVVQSTDGIVQNQITSIGQDFTDNANLVYNYGDEARIVADYSFPDKIVNMSIENNRSLLFQVEGRNGVKSFMFFFDFDVFGNFTANDWNVGKKSFEFRTIDRGDAVSITRV